MHGTKAKAQAVLGLGAWGLGLGVRGLGLGAWGLGLGAWGREYRVFLLGLK